MIKYIILSFILFSLFSCKNNNVYVDKELMVNYPNEKIDSLLRGHEPAHKLKINPPSNVTNIFNVYFPEAKDVEWEMSDFLFEVEFELGNTDYEAYFDKDALLVAYEYEMREEDIPAIILNAAVGAYPDYDIDDIVKIFRGKDIVYKLKLKKAHQKPVIFLLHDGTILEDFPL